MGGMGGSSIYNEIWWMLYSEGGIGCGGETQTGHVLLHLLPTDVRLEVKPLAHLTLWNRVLGLEQKEMFRCELGASHLVPLLKLIQASGGSGCVFPHTP